MVVVQTGQHGPTRSVQHVLGGRRRKGVGTLVDRCVHPQVDGRALQRHRVLDQHGAPSLSATSDSTAALSAPSGAAGPTAGANVGDSAGAPESGDCGRAAYRAATWAIDTSTTSPPPRRSDSPTARAASSPVSGSAIASPQNTGPSAPPPTSPPATAASSPNAGRAGWSREPLIRNQIRPARPARSSALNPRRRSAAGREPSITMSAASSNRCNAPRSSSKSTQYESFPAFLQSKKARSPRRVPSGRVGLSTLT